MSIQLIIREAHGYFALRLGDYLQYFLTPGGLAQGAFACEHRRPIFSINGPGNSAWVLATSGTPNANIFLLDQPPGIYDAYVVTMLFAQAPTYTLRVVAQPANSIVQDIDFASDSPTDYYHHPLMVEQV